MPVRGFDRFRALARHQNFWPAVQLMATFVVVVLASYIVWVTSTEASARTARISSENRTRVSECFDRNTQGPITERFLNVLGTILQNQIVLTRTHVNITGESAPGFILVVACAKQSLVDINDYRTLVKTTTPTKRECLDLAKRLEVRVGTS